MKQSKQKKEDPFVRKMIAFLHKVEVNLCGKPIATEEKKLNKQELEDWLCEAVTACWRREKIKNPEWYAKADAYSQLYDLIQTLPE